MIDNAKPSVYAKIVAEAEAAVAAMKDPELRRVAFEKILETLLEGEQAESGKGKAPLRPHKDDPGNTGWGKRAARQSRQGPKSYVETLIDDGFFKEQRTIAEVKAELANRGHYIPLTSLSGPLQKITQERRLRRRKITVNGKGTKTTYGYSNW